MAITDYKSIQNTVLATVITDMGAAEVEGYSLVSFETTIDSTDTLTYTVIMRRETADV